jgi:hypothetical protein
MVFDNERSSLRFGWWNLAVGEQRKPSGPYFSIWTKGGLTIFKIILIVAIIAAVYCIVAAVACLVAASREIELPDIEDIEIVE